MPSITVVDDCKELAELICHAFEKQKGFQCLCLVSLSEVMKHRAKVLSSQAIILDINLGPGEPDGVEISAWLKEQSYQGSIFFLTGHAANSPFALRATQTNLPILEKPMPTSELVSTVLASITTQMKRLS